ncbi:MAG TPA: sigma-54 dependent transcriptional regulator, partial [Polyangiaceae bacterium]
MAQVLVVDDEEGIREFIAEALEHQHQVASAADAQQALAALSAKTFDLMLTDLKMPGTSGLELLRRAKELQPDLEVIVLTAHGTVNTAVEAMKRGAFDFLQKPVSGPDELRLLCERALERRNLLAERESRDRLPEAPPLSYGDATMQRVVVALKKVARTEATVLLFGESGTGKEVAARALHAWSDRAGGPFVAINCAALSDNLLESELFGHEKGAFTGATAARRGRIELAAQGTFFLDEVGELKPELQAKLLRVLQERSFERVGGSRTVQADVRWVAATNR